MSKKLLILAHGIGDAPKDFYKPWQDAIAKNHDLSDVVVRGLWWEDVLQKVADKYPVISGPFADIIKMYGYDGLDRWLNGADAKQFKDYIMDVLVYVGLPEMWLYIQNECALRLAALRRDAAGKEEFKRSDTILVGHSLGAAMLPQLVWRECVETGAIGYRGMLLLASPIGFESPIPKRCGDFLGRMGLPDNDRISVLTGFARAWNMVGDGCLRFINNENDIVCSDVKFSIPGTGELLDLIPLRQSFDSAESSVLNTEHKGSLQWVSFGTPDPRKVGENHDALAYFNQKPFNEALAELLK